MKIYVRELKSYSLYMNVSLKEAHFMHWCVKGHLIPDEWPDQDIVKMYDSYFKRIWGNHEIQVYSKESFEEAWIIKYEEKN
tara:strand:+ start:496 stop:738 length:243 start_codon:yes stop_codon:yes gene_type:complete